MTPVRALAHVRRRAHRLATIAVCVLPAVGIVPTPHGWIVGSYLSACPGPGVAPTVRTTYATRVHPAPRPKKTPVIAYWRGQEPPPGYHVIGTVSVLSHTTQDGLDNLRVSAQNAARQMGGDAIIDMWWDDAASVKPKAGAQGMLYLTARVARWE